jgi:hypothetical protein
VAAATKTLGFPNACLSLYAISLPTAGRPGLVSKTLENQAPVNLLPARCREI